MSKKPEIKLTIYNRDQLKRAYNLLKFGCTKKHAAEQVGITVQELEEVMKSEEWDEVKKSAVYYQQ